MNPQDVDGEPASLTFGITGHQEREGIDWSWVRARILDELNVADRPIRGLTSLARGADQIFAEAVLEVGGALTAIVPVDDYERFFDGQALSDYRRLLAASDVLKMPPTNDDQAGFLAAGILAADDCEVLIAVWDGEDARGSGGTGDIVAHARRIGRRMVHLQPITREVVRS